MSLLLSDNEPEGPALWKGNGCIPPTGDDAGAGCSLRSPGRDSFLIPWGTGDRAQVKQILTHLQPLPCNSEVSGLWDNIHCTTSLSAWLVTPLATFTPPQTDIFL